MRRFFLSVFLVLFIGLITSTQAAVINFAGQLHSVELDLGGAVYSGVPLGTDFSGSMDDTICNGSIANHAIRTDFGCCIAAGCREIVNDLELDQDLVAFLNALGYSYNVGDVVDAVNIEGDKRLANGNRIEIGLSYYLDADAFNDSNPDDFSLAPEKIQVGLFFIFEENVDNQDIYSAIGKISPAPIFSVPSTGISGILGMCIILGLMGIVALRARQATSHLKIKVSVPGKAQNGQKAEHTRRM
jgi:hypothetical protein